MKMYKTFFTAIESVAYLVNSLGAPALEIKPKSESRLEQAVNAENQQLSWEEIIEWMAKRVDSGYLKFAALDYLRDDISKKATRLFNSALKIKTSKRINDKLDPLKDFEVYSNSNGTHKVVQHSENSLVINLEINSESGSNNYFSISVSVSNKEKIDIYRFSGYPSSYPNSFSASINGKRMFWDSRSNPLLDIRLLSLYVRTIDKMQEIVDVYSK